MVATPFSARREAALVVPHLDVWNSLLARLVASESHAFGTIEAKTEHNVLQEQITQHPGVSDTHLQCSL